MAESEGSGAVNLEKELTCAICTEILYQPLTLLDCLHTFCGSCLKLWFPVQAAQSSSSRSNPYSCPTCRKSVRATSSDAKINTLLDMYLLANPDKAKSEDEKKEIAGKYTKGENVLLKRSERHREDVSNSDRRMIEEVREMSLSDSSSRQHRRGYERGFRHRQNSRERRRDDHRSRESAETSAQARHIEHQSSLRSLISNDDADSNEMVQEILRQISEEGLLDGIDIQDLANIQNLDASQLSEVHERIAAACRRIEERGRSSPSNRTSSPTREPPSPSTNTRTNRSSRASSARRDGPSPSAASRTSHSSRPNSSTRPAVSTSSPRIGTEGTSPGRTRVRSSSATDDAPTSHPPVSRPHLLEAESARLPRQRRRSNESRSQTSPVPQASPAQQQAARSATDLSAHHGSASARDIRPHLNPTSRSSTEPRTRRQSDSGDRPRLEGSRVSPRTSNHRDVFLSRSDVGVSRQNDKRPTAIETSRVQVSSAPTTPRMLTPNQPHAATQDSPRTAPTEANQVERSKFYPEVSVSCDRCGKQHIEYDLHENCSICKEGNYNICHRCYREGKGCLSWFGFGVQAWYRFQWDTSQHNPPHALVGRKYTRPMPNSIQPHTDGMIMTTEEPSKRLQIGAFCSRCQSFANDLFWKCDECNDGEWGFCNRCVNTGHCCTHPLLPLANISTLKSSTTNMAATHPEASLAPITSPEMVQAYPPTNISSPAKYRPLTFSTTCNICMYPIQPSQSRFHCYTCSDGDYDICNPCYARLVDSGRIKREDSDKGWRRCLKDHRMVKVWFKDSQFGQQRVIENDLVGGWFLEDREQDKGEWSWIESGQRRTKTLSQRMFDEKQSADDATENVMLRKFLPDGGVGLHAQAIHPWLPSADSVDELSFPRGAEIREIWEMNHWLLGSYAGDKGLFPRNHVTILRNVTA